VLAATEDLAQPIISAYQRHGLIEQAQVNLNEPTRLSFDEKGTEHLLADLEQIRVSETDALEDPPIEQSDNTLVRLINTMIVEANSQGASDIHIEPQPGRGKLRVRFRLDGVLKPYLELPHTYRNALVARIKIMCDLDISERRRPRTARSTSPVSSRPAPSSCAWPPSRPTTVWRMWCCACWRPTRPCPHREAGPVAAQPAGPEGGDQPPLRPGAVRGPHRLGQDHHAALGPQLHQHARAQDLDGRGPGGNHPGRPAPGAGQPQDRLDLAKALRAFLRADPDVIMVGEIRDEETASIAIESSLTGHLVMSTLHTNSAAETVTRLLDMGLDPSTSPTPCWPCWPSAWCAACARTAAAPSRRPRTGSMNCWTTT
jgi:hypothetical protein